MKFSKKRLIGGRRLIPKHEYPKPFRFVGISIIIMVVIIFLLYRLIVK